MHPLDGPVVVKVVNANFLGHIVSLYPRCDTTYGKDVSHLITVKLVIDPGAEMQALSLWGRYVKKKRIIYVKE